MRQCDNGFMIHVHPLNFSDWIGRWTWARCSMDVSDVNAEVDLNVKLSLSCSCLEFPIEPHDEDEDQDEDRETLTSSPVTMTTKMTTRVEEFVVTRD